MFRKEINWDYRMLLWSFKTACAVFNVVPKSRPLSPVGLHSGCIKINPVVISGWLWKVFLSNLYKSHCSDTPGPTGVMRFTQCDLGVLVRFDCLVCAYPQAWFTVFSSTIMRSVLQMEAFPKARLHCMHVTALVVAPAWRELGQMTHPSPVVVFQGDLCAHIIQYVHIVWQIQRVNLHLTVCCGQTMFFHVRTYFICVQSGGK